MKKLNYLSILLLGAILTTSLLIFNCAQKKDIKMPFTTTSREAKDSFLQGRDLFERLQITESRQYFENAVKADPEFALGYLYLAFAQPTAKGFFEYRDKAEEKMTNASDAEKWYILATEALTGGFPLKAREYYEKMVAAYPRDERAQNLLAQSYFGQQEWGKAIEHYNLALTINPEFSAPYNQKGYAHRFLEQYDEAEQAFRKYTELIPNDPNPYDSYAELLMKMGRYDESIANYEKALQQNPRFVNAFVGIACNLNFKGEYKQAREKLQEAYDNARNDGEKRTALFAMAVSSADEGDLKGALGAMGKQLALDKELNDPSAIAADLQTMGDIYLEMKDYKNSNQMYEATLKTIMDSDLAEDVKQNAQRFWHFDRGKLSVGQNKLEQAKEDAEIFMTKALEANNPFQIKLAHQLKGMIALAENKLDTAIAEFEQSNLQNPYNLYRMGLTYLRIYRQQKANTLTVGMEYIKKAANFNGLSNLNGAFIRQEAKKMAK